MSVNPRPSSLSWTRVVAFGSLLVLAPFATTRTTGAQPLPSYATPTDSRIVGVIRSIDGKYDLTLHDENGYDDRVRLHDGTIINPTGFRLAPGFLVKILGRIDGDHFAASEIDVSFGRRGRRPPPRDDE